jgi:glucose-6-phosphate isomerase
MKKITSRYPTDLPAWQALKTHHREKVPQMSLAALFGKDTGRFERFSLRCGDLLLDYSRNFLTPRTRQLLVRLAREAGVEAARAAMYAGEPINRTEGRPALHVALRGTAADGFRAGGVPVGGDVKTELDRLCTFVDAVHDGGIRGSGGQRFTDVINIGIGGSDLGIVMALRALGHHAIPGIRVHCVSNIDGTQLADLSRSLDPSSTLVVVCSKTFTTLETMTNARAARAWIAEALGEDAVAAHFAAASTNAEAMDAFGVHSQYRFGFWDWVGGRYSLWSAVGLSIALGIGSRRFRALLRGARTMDRHFAEAALGDNMPVLLALVAIWNNNFIGCGSQAILPYDNRLDRFPAYLQQLQMESNGKSVRLDGRRVRAATGAIIWGEAGSNAQHSFYQLLHQGTRVVPADFILPVQSSGATQAQQDLAIANCLAQSDALMLGYSLDQARDALRAKGLDEERIRELAPHKVHPGNRPSNIIMMKALEPETLGQLIALYEHKVFVEGVIWGINSFDQWGVELGKLMASELQDAVARPALAEGANASTRGLLDLAGRWRRR